MSQFSNPSRSLPLTSWVSFSRPNTSASSFTPMRTATTACRVRNASGVRTFEADAICANCVATPAGVVSWGFGRTCYYGRESGVPARCQKPHRETSNPK